MDVAYQPSRPMRVIAIDPGTSNTGLVYMSGSEVFAAKTITHKSSVKSDQERLMERAESIARGIDIWMADKPHDAVVIEGFLQFTGGRANAYTFQTPYLVGYLHATLIGENIVIQTSPQVLNQRNRDNVAWVKDYLLLGKEVLRNDKQCSNDHTRSAMAHGYFYLRNQGEIKDGKEPKAVSGGAVHRRRG